MAREHVRECKALAMQEARQQKLQLSIANKLLPKVVKAQFNLSSMLTGKFGKFPAKNRAEGQNKKTLRSAMVGKAAVDIDEKACSKLCTDAGK